MIYLLLNLFVGSVFAYPVAYLYGEIKLGGKDFKVYTFYDDQAFTGFHTNAYETILMPEGPTYTHLYFHTAWGESSARIQHGLAIAFVRDHHIQTLLKEYEEIKQRGSKRPREETDSEAEVDDLTHYLYDISEDDEELITD